MFILFARDFTNIKTPVNVTLSLDDYLKGNGFFYYL